MITYFQSIILGILQGVSELFPVSSLGHSVILPTLLGWNINQADPFFLTFLVATHTATAIVLIGFFWNDWVKIVKGIGISLQAREISRTNIYGRLGWLLIVGTIPAGILGLLFEQSFRSIFASAQSAAFFLILNGGVLYGAELLRRRKKENTTNPDEQIAKISWIQSLGIGAAQALALVPGFSRSGASMAGSLLVGLSNEEAARFSFLLATPVISAAALLKLPDLFAPGNNGILGPAFVGALCAGVGAYFSVKFLLKYFETNKLTPFAIYSAVAGVVFSIILLLR